jgi:hypothetical protein
MLQTCMSRTVTTEKSQSDKEYSYCVQKRERPRERERAREREFPTAFLFFGRQFSPAGEFVVF